MNTMRWLAARLRKVDPFVGPPLPAGARRDRHGRVYRYRSWWNADFTLHQISAVQLDGRPLPRVPLEGKAGDDFEIPAPLRRIAEQQLPRP